MEGTFSLRIEGGLWEAVWHEEGIISEHPDCLQAIINTGYCDNRESAKEVAITLGVSFDPIFN